MRKYIYLSTCDTCKRIMKEAGITKENFDLQDIKKTPIYGEDLDLAYKHTNSYEALFNKRSRKYAQSGLKEQNLSDEEMQQKIASAKLENSYIGILGKTIEPTIKPLGYDWKIGIALITSFAAREVFVGTLATIYSVEADDEDTSTIKQKMASEINPDTGKKRFNFPVGMSLMVFYAFAMQCMATLAIVKRETKTWKWPLIQLFGMAFLAYVSSLLTYQILS